MVMIPAGEFAMGSNELDPAASDDEFPQHPVFIDAYWIDETEITNNEYRQFVFWVRDSIIRKELAISGVEDFIRKVV